MENIANFIGNLGFPIAVAVYLLIRLESKLEKLEGAIISLTEAVIKSNKA